MELQRNHGSIIKGISQMKTSMKQARKEYQAIEEAFYDLDREQKTVRIRLQYEKPEKIFDCNAGTKIPLMSGLRSLWNDSIRELL